MSLEKELFKKGSTTYYWSSRFFPKEVREDVFKFYSFVRYVDDLVDRKRPNVKEFDSIVVSWSKWKSEDKQDVDLPSGSAGKVLQNMIGIVEKYDCNESWVDAFLTSMQMDIDQKNYKSLEEVLEYIYGSAEIIGLVMARILQLPSEADFAARMQGRAMQYINFIRDIDEDNGLGRRYFSDKTLSTHKLKSLTRSEAEKHQEQFTAFIREQIELYREWQELAYKGFEYIPKRLRIPVATATDMYNWTAEQIYDNPLVVFDRKVKPSKYRVMSRAFYNSYHV